jgi:hypothetical protein
MFKIRTNNEKMITQSTLIIPYLHLSDTRQTVLRIRDVCPGSRILIFIHPGSGSKNARKKGEKFFVLPFFCSNKYQKNYFWTCQEK